MSKCLSLKKSNCKNCYKCIRNCQVKAIRFSGNQAHIIDNECIHCGQCYVTCPQDAKVIVSEREKVKVMLQSGEPVVASIAPSFITYFGEVGIKALKDALIKLGFKDVEETAIGATIVKNEYERILQEEDREVVITSSCHSVNLLIQKYYPASLKYLAQVISPMHAHCIDIKKRNPIANTVFIGPCIAKKDEASTIDDVVDAVLTFEEIENWLNEEGIEVKKEMDSNENSRARFFPTTGGILKTMSQNINGYTYLTVDGIENCMAALKDIENGKISKCFIEMSACVGSCVNGPIMRKKHKSSISDFMTVANYAGEKDFIVNQPKEIELKKNFDYINKNEKQPSDIEIGGILRQMGKIGKSQELNCGSCGYNTCREKAIAIYQGKAEVSMCLPFLKDKAESFSDTIVKNTPNGLVVLNEKLEVQQINAAARKIMNIRTTSDVLGENVVRILDPKIFMESLNTKKTIKNRRTYLAEYNRYVEQTVVFDSELHLLVGIIT
ncbi:MAG: 4Fe-4S binding protein, partial [Clostridia bacterium]|nr:4Fe-4S binding protein [Clostridia bacterium]